MQVVARRPGLRVVVLAMSDSGIVGGRIGTCCKPSNSSIERNSQDSASNTYYRNARLLSQQFIYNTVRVLPL